MLKIRTKIANKLTYIFRVFIESLLFIRGKNSKYKEGREGGLYFFDYFFDKIGTLRIFHRGTHADRGVIDQVIFNQDYNIEKFKQSEWVNNAYNLILSVGKKPLIIDAGANIGISSLYLKNKYPLSEVKAIEPSNKNIKLMLMNNFSGVEIIHGAINSESEYIVLSDVGDGEWGFTTHQSSIKECSFLETVKCYKLEDFLDEGLVPFFLKIDIEGGEKNELLNFKFLSKFAVIVIELHDWLYPGERTSHSFSKLLANIDFDIVYSGENIFLFNRLFANKS